MSFVNKVYFGIKALHNALEETAYLLRYKSNDLQSLDHYRHLCQLLPIYTALEKKLKHENFSPQLPNEYEYLLNQTIKLEADLTFLETHFSKRISKQREILAATQLFVKKIEKMEVKKNVFNVEIFGCFLSRIFGDLEGGQTIKEYVRRMYLRNGLSDRDINAGVDFYCFPKDTLKNFSAWCENLKLSANTKSMIENNELEYKDQLTTEDLNLIIAYTNKSLEAHLPIFTELEKTRVNFSISKIAASLFSCRNVVIGTTALVAGIAISTQCYSKN